MSSPKKCKIELSENLNFLNDRNLARRRVVCWLQCSLCPKIGKLPVLWRLKSKLPTTEGIIVDCIDHTSGVSVFVNDNKINALVFGESGVGKTSRYLCPSIEYCCAAGMSFVAADIKGEILQTGTIAKEYYGYKINVLDLRNPTYSNGYNILFQVGKYMDVYKSEGRQENIEKSEMFAKATARSVLAANGRKIHKQSLYKATENLLTAVIITVADFCAPEKRHISSVFKLIDDLIRPSETTSGERIKQFFEKLPSGHAARQYANEALKCSEQEVIEIISSISHDFYLSNGAKYEQILCCDNSIDIEDFCDRKTAVYVIVSELA